MARWRSLIALVLSCVSPIVVAQTTVSIDLKDTDGYGPFFPSSVITSPLRTQPEGYVTPKNLVFSRIRSFNFQPDQSMYWAYLNGKIPKKNLLRRLGKTDTLLLTKTIFHNELFILVGRNSTGSTVVIPDLNDNHSFLDDAPIIFKDLPDMADQMAANRNEPKINVEYNYFNGHRIEKRSTVLKLSAYPANFSASYNNSTDSLDKSVFLHVGLANHKEGDFTVNGKLFKVAIYDSRDAGYSKNGSMIIFGRQEEEFPNQGSYLPQGIGETTSVEGEEFKIDSLDATDSKLYLTYLGYHPIVAGHTEGYYLPSMQGRTLDDRAIDGSAFKGKILLINFWGTWNAPGMAAMPQLKSIRDKYAPDGLVVLGVVYDVDGNYIYQITRQKEWDWTNVFQDRSHDGPENEFVDKLKVDHYPTFFLVNRQGKILLRSSDLNAVEKALKEIF